jgi:hypothetical protein
MPALLTERRPLQSVLTIVLLSGAAASLAWIEKRNHLLARKRRSAPTRRTATASSRATRYAVTGGPPRFRPEAKFQRSVVGEVSPIWTRPFADDGVVVD